MSAPRHRSDADSVQERMANSKAVKRSPGREPKAIPPSVTLLHVSCLDMTARHDHLVPIVQQRGFWRA